MPQRTVNIELTDGQTGKKLGGHTVELQPFRYSDTPPAYPMTIQFQDGISGEWKTITDLSNVRGFDIDPTPTGFVVENYTPGKSELTATFDIATRVTDTRLRVDLVAAYMKPYDVYKFEFIQVFGRSYYMEYCYRRYTAQLNHTRPCHKQSWRRLSWKQKARAIAIAGECDWYDDYYYGRV